MQNCVSCYFTSQVKDFAIRVGVVTHCWRPGSPQMHPHLVCGSESGSNQNLVCSRRSVVGTRRPGPRYDLSIRIQLPPIRLYIPSRLANFKHDEKCIIAKIPPPFRLSIIQYVHENHDSYNIHKKSLISWSVYERLPNQYYR